MNNSGNIKSSFKTIQIIYGALIFGVLAMSVLIYSMLEDPIYKVDMSDKFFIIVPILTVIGIFLSSYLYRLNIDKIESRDSLPSKLTKYQSANIIKGAVLEASALFASVASLLTNNLLYLVFTLVLLVVMYLKLPTLLKFENEVVLDMKEKSELKML